MSGTQRAIPTSSSGKAPMEVAVPAARAAGDVIMGRFYTTKEVSFKGRANLVTDVDLLAEREAIQLLLSEYPDFGVLSEESEPIVRDSPYKWVLDPIDGTRNFAMGVPHFCVVVALARDGEVVVGVTYDPVRQELFSAEAGKGASVNGTPFSVSPRDQLEESVLAFDMGYVDQKAVTALDMLRSLWPGLQGIRLMGSAALGLAYAASGRVDLYFHHNLSPWDIASGLLLASEAGGVVVDRNGNPATLGSESVILANPGLVARFLEATDGMPWRNGG